jgi:hypothetical protein
MRLATRMKRNMVPTMGKYLRHSGPIRSCARLPSNSTISSTALRSDTPSSGTTPPPAWAIRRRIRRPLASRRKPARREAWITHGI